MPRLGKTIHRAGMILLVGVLGWGDSASLAQEEIVPHSRSAVYNFGPSYYIPPQVSASPSVGVGSSAYPAYANPYSMGMPYGSWGMGGGWGMYQRMPWGPQYRGGQGPYSVVPRSF